MLSFEKVDAFLTKKLGLSNWKVLLEESKLEFLKVFNLAFCHHLYFQNLSFSAIPIADRKCPTTLDSFEMVLDKFGACCIQNNFVFKEILNFLGYDAIIVGCNMPVWDDIPNCHVLTLVRFKQPVGEKDHIYTVDVGYARPHPEIGPLHLVPFRGNVGGFEFEVRFNKETGFYERIMIDGCCSYGTFKEAGQKIDYYFNLTPMDFQDFDWSMTKIFVAPESTFLGNIFIYRLTRVESMDDFDYICLRGKSICEGSKKTFKLTKVETFMELAPYIQKYFPNVPQSDMNAALLYFQIYEEEMTAKGLLEGKEA